MISIAFTTAICIATLIFTPISSAQPLVSGVQGIFAHDQYITITGSDFGTKNPARPLVWADFEGGDHESEDGSLSTGTISLTNLSSTTANQPHNNSTYSIRGQPGGRWSGLRTGDSSNKNIFIFARRFWGSDNWFTCTGSAQNTKIVRFWPTCSSGYPNFIIEWGTPGHLFYKVETSQSTSSCNANPPPENVWIIEEIQWDTDSSGSLDLWYNGTLWCSPDSVTGGSAPSCLILQSTWNDCSPPPGSYMYLDDVYMDDTWARVMIGDNSDFDSCTHREIQIPTAWSNNSINIKINQGYFNNVETVFLFVVDADGDVNSQGYPITIGGGGTSIQSPTGLKVKENCTNGVDDDRDGLIDCNDPDCSSDPSCN